VHVETSLICKVAEYTAEGSSITMEHWTDYRRIHSLMMHLGKTVKTDKPTRSAFVAEQAREDLLNQNPNADLKVFSQVASH